MEKIGLNEIRDKFRSFYESKGHYPRKSFSLVPEKDKSLLVINSGMAPLKPYFAGLETPPSNRMTTCQKCIRTGDLDNVGYTSRHGTFFEMLGSFSFGDYFKKQSLEWGWEFMIDVLKLPEDRLWASVYEEDDEAYDIWVNHIGMPPERVVRLGKEDNFWEIGIGPCGPCSEVYFDRGEKFGCDNPDCKPGCECDRYVEFWNHVFTQFNRDEEGNYTPLENPNIDTGMGLERIACIMQDTDSIFDVDTIKHVLDDVVKVSGIQYQYGEAKTDISIRIITDHIRSVTFLLSDGVMPSNEERGYLLRKLLRRAAVHGKKLGINELFLYELADRVIESSGKEYEELVEKRDYIKKLIKIEEEKFSVTIDQGQDLLNSYIEQMDELGQNILSGEQVFKLYDTHGYNPELTKEILAEHEIEIDEEGYMAELKAQQETSRRARKVGDEEAWSEDDKIFKNLEKTEFTGYEQLTDDVKIQLIISDGEKVSEAGENETVSVVFDKTPFYAEGGGQASDIGELKGKDFYAHVNFVEKVQDVFVHKVEIKEGSITANQTLTAIVDRRTRNSTARNHTATHILHKALKKALGDHVQQAGSSVNSEELRFDFTHFEDISAHKLNEVELIVNNTILDFLPVTTEITTPDEAKEGGAVGLFDEKYGDKVRVVSVGDFSKELCGGTHVSNSGQIGVFKITSESSVGAGMRRIEAITGNELLRPLTRAENMLTTLGGMFKSNPDMIVQKIETILEDFKNTKKELESVKKEMISDSLDSIIDDATEINDIKLVRKTFDDLEVDDLRDLCDQIKAEINSVVIVLASTMGGKVTFVVSVSDDLIKKGYSAGKLIKEIAKAAGGGGGGKPDMAQAGAKDPSKVEDGMKLAESLLQ